MKYLKRIFLTIFCAFLPLAIASATTEPSAIKIDAELRQMSADKDVISKGKKSYETYCLACHAKDLSGGNGFNLKDGIWIHGSRPSDILSSVNKGFLTQGMPSFNNILPEVDRKQIVAYVLSKREGFDKLHYTVYKLQDNDDTSLAGKTPVKTGVLHDNLMDFTLPEMKEFGIVFEGDFYTYSDQPTRFRMGGRAFDLMELEIDGHAVEKLWKKGWNPTWPLKPGRQHLKLTYLSSKNPDYLDTNFLGYVTPKDGSIKFFATTARAQSLMANRTFKIEAKNQAVLQRKKIHELPTGSIGIGLPAQINYAFNPNKCEINALWLGGFLNIGPNIDRRTGDPSLPLGKPIFNSPAAISPKAVSCKYVGYERDNNITFNFIIDDVEVDLSANAISSNKIAFTYIFKQNTSVVFSLPHNQSLHYSSEHGKIAENNWHLSSSADTAYTLKVSINNSGLTEEK